VQEVLDVSSVELRVIGQPRATQRYERQQADDENTAETDIDLATSMVAMVTSGDCLLQEAVGRSTGNGWSGSGARKG